MEYQLRDAVSEDEQWVNSLTEQTMGSYIRETWDTDSEYRHYLDLNCFDLGTTKIIIADGKKAGRISYCRDGQTFHLDNLHLDSDFHGRGLGTRIILDTLEIARAESLPLELKCLKTNPVQTLYIRMGFTLIKEDEKRLYYRIY
ncbi:MAG: GNAT family N-acetyltransferase [Spirochaetales bacterium]|nr:GNAT family N-acetyltransferase [Spirochaetales bacterium]